MFEGENMMRGAWSHFMTREGPDGVSHAEREEQRRQRIYEIADRRHAHIIQNVQRTYAKLRSRQGKQQRSNIRKL